MSCAVLYARISERQMVRDENGKLVPISDSIDSQLEACRALATSRRMAVVAEYVDRLATGTKARENLTKALAHAKRVGGALIVRDLHRATRSPSLMSDIADFCRKHKVSILTVDGLSLDFTDPRTSPIAELMATQLAAFGKFECRSRANAISIARQQKRERGEYEGGSCPYGLRVVGGKLKPHLGELEAVKKILYWRDRKASLDTICYRLGREGHRPRKGGAWCRTTVDRICKYWRSALRDGGAVGERARRLVGSAVGIVETPNS